MRAGIALFNHLLKQQPEVRADLSALAGRRVALMLAPFSLKGVITGEGWLAESQGEAEASVRVRPLAAWRAQWSGRAPAFDDVLLEGDRALAQTFAHLIGRLRWQPADDLSRIVGDVAAQRIETGVKNAMDLQGRMSWRLLDNWLEYWREEDPLLAKKADIEDFVMAVDTLRDDAERMSKRLERLEADPRPTEQRATGQRPVDP